MSTTPKIKRTRRHVVVRLTPAEAKTLAYMANGFSGDTLPKKLRRHRPRIFALLRDAEAAGETTPPPAPKATSIGRGLPFPAEMP